jgi:hypothetical protein
VTAVTPRCRRRRMTCRDVGCRPARSGGPPSGRSRSGAGKAAGAPGAAMRWRRPDEVVPHFPEGACACGPDLAGAAGLGVFRSYQREDVPGPQPSRRAPRPRPASSSCNPPAPTAGRSPCHGRSGGFPCGRSTALSGPSGHRAGRHGRHDLRWQQRLPPHCLVSQTGMITAAAPAFRCIDPCRSRAGPAPLPACAMRL